jgi:hypothetical protein
MPVAFAAQLVQRLRDHVRLRPLPADGRGRASQRKPSLSDGSSTVRERVERRAAHRQPSLFEDVLAGRGHLDVEP